MKRGTLYKLYIAIFLLLIIAPMFGILREKRNAKNILEMENRLINPWPQHMSLDSRYFDDLSKWFDDRLLGRKQLVALWGNFNSKIFGLFISKEVVEGKEGQLFRLFQMGKDFRDAEKKLDRLAEMSSFCAARGAQFYVFIAPNSEMVLGELYPPEFERIDTARLEGSIAEQLNRRAVKNIAVMAAMDSLPLEEKRQMYLKGDYHWTNNGGYFAAKAILQAIGASDVINAEVYRKSAKVKSNGLANQVGKFDDETVITPWSKKFRSDFTVTDSLTAKTYLFDSPDIPGGIAHHGENIILNQPRLNAGGKIILVLGDSFFPALSSYLMQDIGKIVHSHNSDVSSPKKYIDLAYLLDTYRPDIVIYEKMAGNFLHQEYGTVFDNIRF